MEIENLKIKILNEEWRFDPGCLFFKKYYKDPSTPEYVVIRMKPEGILLMAGVGKGYEDIEVPK